MILHLQLDTDSAFHSTEVTTHPRLARLTTMNHPATLPDVLRQTFRPANASVPVLFAVEPICWRCAWSRAAPFSTTSGEAPLARI